jgi:hypothetical protein
MGDAFCIIRNDGGKEKSFRELENRKSMIILKETI